MLLSASWLAFIVRLSLLVKPVGINGFILQSLWPQSRFHALAQRARLPCLALPWQRALTPFQR